MCQNLLINLNLSQTYILYRYVPLIVLQADSLAEHLLALRLYAGQGVQLRLEQHRFLVGVDIHTGEVLLAPFNFHWNIKGIKNKRFIPMSTTHLYNLQ